METIYNGKINKHWQIIHDDGTKTESTSVYRVHRNALQRFFKQHPGITHFTVTILKEGSDG